MSETGTLKNSGLVLTMIHHEEEYFGIPEIRGEIIDKGCSEGFFSLKTIF